eukprot:11204573-Lingulodinium_polyedra.AAC.1
MVCIVTAVRLRARVRGVRAQACACARVCSRCARVLGTCMLLVSPDAHRPGCSLRLPCQA